MKVYEYCENAALQLTFWKQELFDVAITAQHFHSPGKQVIEPELKKLMLLIDEIGKKIELFKKECLRDSKSVGETHEELAVPE